MFQHKLETHGKGAQSESTPGVDVLPKDELSDPLADPILRKPNGNPAIAAQSAFSRATEGGGGEVPHRAGMESTFGQDFGSVRAFTGKGDETSAMGAEAATQGESVVFGDASPSKEVVGHELAHVVQNRGGSTPMSSGPFGDPGGSAEHEADLAGEAAASGVRLEVSGAPGGGIQLRKKPGNDQIDVPAFVSAAVFKEKTAVTLARRGKNLSAIDNWLKALDGYTTDDKAAQFDHALHQAIDASEHWLKNHDADQKIPSIRYRHPVVGALWKALKTVNTGTPCTDPIPGRVPPQTQQDEGDEDGVGFYDVAESVSGMGPSGIEKIGLGGDIHQHSKYSTMNDKGQVDRVEGGFMIGGGGIEIFAGMKKVQEGDKEGLLDIGTGGSMVGAGIGKLYQAHDKATGGSGAGAGKVGEGFGTAGVMLGGISEVVDLVKETKKAKEDPGMTVDQKVFFATNRVQNMIGIARSVSDSVNGITKAVTNTASVGAAATSGVLGTVTGGIDVGEGIYQVSSGMKHKKDLEKVETQLGDTTNQLAREKADLLTAKSRGAAELLRQSKPQEAIDQLRQEYDDLIEKVEEAQQELENEKEELTATLDTMKKVQDRRMKSGLLKGVTGTMDVVSGALMLSGVGAPVAVSLAVLSGLIKLGSTGLEVGRSYKASKLTEIALRPDDQGNAKGKPDDPEQVGYRTMKKRVLSAYYAHYGKAIDNEPPEGMDKSSWGHVRDFVLEEKLSRLQSTDTAKIKESELAGKSKDQLQSSWGQITDNGGDVLKNEYPSTSTRAALIFTFSAHKSAQAIDASNAELSEAVLRIARSTFNPETKSFVSVTVHATGTPPKDQVKAVKEAAAVTLLKNVGISLDVWMKLWRGAGGHFEGDPKTPSGTHDDAAPPDWAALQKLVKSKIDAT